MGKSWPTSESWQGERVNHSRRIVFEKQAGEHQVVVNSTTKNLLSGRFGRISSIIGRLWSNHNHHASKYRIFDCSQESCCSTDGCYLSQLIRKHVCQFHGGYYVLLEATGIGSVNRQCSIEVSVLYIQSASCVSSISKKWNELSKFFFSYPDSSASIPR